ncbi:hypothetical protein OF001_U150065 [Pseudomonas sp. OF001]|nr:hypothetical protein OF001_U150065 [Pseudomonas sp. OF001]
MPHDARHSSCRSRCHGFPPFHRPPRPRQLRAQPGRGAGRAPGCGPAGRGAGASAAARRTEPAAAARATGRRGAGLDAHRAVAKRRALGGGRRPGQQPAPAARHPAAGARSRPAPGRQPGGGGLRLGSATGWLAAADRDPAGHGRGRPHRLAVSRHAGPGCRAGCPGRAGRAGRPGAGRAADAPHPEPGAAAGQRLAGPAGVRRGQACVARGGADRCARRARAAGGRAGARSRRPPADPLGALSRQARRAHSGIRAAGKLAA